MSFQQLNLTGKDKFDHNDLIDEDSDDDQNEILLRFKKPEAKSYFDNYIKWQNNSTERIPAN